MKKIWRVEMDGIIEHEYEDVVYEYFLNEDLAKNRLSELKKEYIREDGSYLPNYTYITFSMDEISIEEFKEEATIADFEKLFGCELTDFILNSDTKKKYDISISADSGVTIQKELTEHEYQLIKHISAHLECSGDGYQGTLDIEESK